MKNVFSWIRFLQSRSLTIAHTAELVIVLSATLLGFTASKAIAETSTYSFESIQINPPEEILVNPSEEILASSSEISSYSNYFSEPEDVYSAYFLANNDLDQELTDATLIRQELKIEPVVEVSSQQTYAPGTSAGIPSAFGANWGDLSFGVSGATADNIRLEADGSLAFSLGLGNSRDSIGLELSYNVLSIRQFAQNGSFDAKIHRNVYQSQNTQIAAAVGWNNFARYGNDTAGSSSSVYGVVTGYHFLKPDDSVNPLPVNVTFGVGGAPAFSNSESGIGMIAGVGIQANPNIGFSTAWSGRGFNLSGSYLPVRTLPLTLNLVYGDIFNNTDAGSVIVLSVGYGFNFTPDF